MKVAHLCLALCDPMDYSPWTSPSQNTGVGSLSLLQGNLPNPGIEPRPPALWVDSLLPEPPGKPKNTGVGSQWGAEMAETSVLWRSVSVSFNGV